MSVDSIMASRITELHALGIRKVV